MSVNILAKTCAAVTLAGIIVSCQNPQQPASQTDELSVTTTSDSNHASIAAPPTAPAADYNTVFDSVLVSDTTIPVIAYTGDIPAATATKQAGKLTYNKKASVYAYVVKQALENGTYTNEDKVQFIKDALQDKKRDVFQGIERFSISFFTNSEPARKLMDGYFKKNPSRYFEFQVNNNYPGCDALIAAYVKSRSSQKTRYRSEEKIIYRLIQLGKEKQALELLDMLVRDVQAHRITELPTGDRDEDANVFDLLCFSKDEAIRDGAKELLWTYSSLKENSDLMKLGMYLDEPAAIEILKKWFQHYATMDFSKVDPTIAKRKQEQLTVLLPALRAYASFMFRSAPYLGKAAGKQLWTEFTKKMPYWEAYDAESFDSKQLYIIEGVFQDVKPSAEEKVQMLYDMKLTDRFFTASDYYGSFPTRYLQLVREVYPDGHVTQQEFTRLQLNRIMPYSNPIHYPAVNPEKAFFNETEVVDDINNYGLGDVRLQVSLPGYQQFKKSLRDFDYNFRNLFWQTDWVKRFDCESAETPSSYSHLFVDAFQVLLEKKGITDITVGQVTKKTGDGYTYQVFVGCKEGSYKMVCNDTDADRYNPQRLVKMINLVLKKKQLKERLVQISTGDQTAEFGLFEPAKVKPFLSKYNVASYAVDRKDAFSDLK